MRNHQFLNFGWKYLNDYAKDFTSEFFDDSYFHSVDLPHSSPRLPLNYIDHAKLNIIGCYRKRFDLSREMKRGKLILHFDGAASYTEVYLNSRFICDHRGAYTPFSVDITDQCRDTGNVLVVMSDGRADAEIPPFGGPASVPVPCGLHGEVWLESVGDPYVTDIFVRTRNLTPNAGDLDIDISLSKAHSGQIAIVLHDNGIIRKRHTASVDSDKLSARFSVDDIVHWTIDQPHIYTIRVSLEGKDIYEQRFGFREVEFHSDGFYLNGEHIKLRGLRRYNSFPYVGSAMPAEIHARDADILKHELGVNVVWAAGGAPSRHFLDRCDEIGLLVISEMQGWRHVGEDDWREVYLTNLAEMIRRDRNHPSIILWGVRVSEVEDGDELFEKANMISRSYDSTRQTVGARGIASETIPEDVFAYIENIGDSLDHLINTPAMTHPDTPYIVAGHTGHLNPVKPSDHCCLHVDQALRHARVLDKMYADSSIAGAAGSSFADYISEGGLQNGDSVCYHGVTDMFRIPKPSAAFYASQQSIRPVLSVPYAMSSADVGCAGASPFFIFTNCDYVKVIRNSAPLCTLYPDKTSYPSLPHPPMVLRDLIGETLLFDNGVTEQNIERVREIIRDGEYADEKPSFIRRQQMKSELKKFGLTPEDIKAIYKKLAKRNTCANDSWKFEGYIDDSLAVTVVREPFADIRLVLVPDRETLFPSRTYDATRVVIRLEDQNGNLLIHADNTVSISVAGDAELIGPTQFSLQGGTRAFWLRSRLTSGEAVIMASSLDLPLASVKIKIEFPEEKILTPAENEYHEPDFEQPDIAESKY